MLCAFNFFKYILNLVNEQQIMYESELEIISKSMFKIKKN
jgi:hypothetical protein